MEQPPLISILIPAHKSGRFARALASACSQSYPNLEIVVSDDSGGTEIERITREQADPRIRYSRHPHPNGIDAGYRRAFELACGKWALFLDDDDIIYPDAVATLAAALAAVPGATMAYAGYDYINEKPVRNRPTNTPIRIIPPPSLALRSGKEYFLTFRDFTPLTITLLLDVETARRAAIFTATGPTKCADWDAWLRIGALGNVVTVSQALGCHFFHADSFSARDFLTEDLDAARFIDIASAFAVDHAVLTDEEARAWRRMMRRWYIVQIFSIHAPRRRYGELGRGFAHTLAHHPEAAIASLPTLLAGLLLGQSPKLHRALCSYYRRRFTHSKHYVC